MKNFRCKICGEEFEKMPKMCPTPGCGNRNPAMWENIAPKAPRPVLTDEEQRELERRKAEERRRLESEEKSRLIEQQRAAEAERQRELDRIRYEEQQRQQAEAEKRRRLEAEEKARRLEQQRYAAEQDKLRQEQQRQREEIERQRIEQEQLWQQADSTGQAAAYQNRQTGDFSGYGNTPVYAVPSGNAPAKPKKKKIIKVLVIIMLLLLLVLAGMILWAKFGRSSSDKSSSDKAAHVLYKSSAYAAVDLDKEGFDIDDAAIFSKSSMNLYDDVFELYEFKKAVMEHLDDELSENSSLSGIDDADDFCHKYSYVIFVANGYYIEFVAVAEGYDEPSAVYAVNDDIKDKFNGMTLNEIHEFIAKTGNFSSIPN